jgi:hypothetical protein
VPDGRRDVEWGAPTMTPEFLSRLQFALTASFHFIAAIGIPFVLLCTAGAQHLFRGKVRLTGDSY